MKAHALFGFDALFDCWFPFTGRNAPFANLTCVDCLKDFHGQDYVQHTKCVSESERYAAKGTFVAKPDKNKGAQKQEIWTECIEELASRTDLDKSLRDILQRIAGQSNVPRKKPKFINFLKSSMRFNVYRAEQVWKVIEEGLEEFKKRAAPPPRPNASTTTEKDADAPDADSNGIESQTNGNAEIEQTCGEKSVHVNGTTKVGHTFNAKQIDDIFSYALVQPDLNSLIRKKLKILQKSKSELPLNVSNSKERKKFTAFVQNRYNWDKEISENLWTIVSDAASVINEESKVTNDIAAATNGNAEKRKSNEDAEDSDARSKKPKLAKKNAVDGTDGNEAADFDWQKYILRIFNKNSTDNAIDLATIRTKVIKRYVKHIGGNDDDAAAQHAKKFKKQLKRVDGLIIENGMIKSKP